MWEKISGPLPLYRTGSDGKLGRAWEWGYVATVEILMCIHLSNSYRQHHIFQSVLYPFPLRQLPTLSILTSLFPMRSLSTLTKWELTKWKLTKWEDTISCTDEECYTSIHMATWPWPRGGRTWQCSCRSNNKCTLITFQGQDTWMQATRLLNKLIYTHKHHTHHTLARHYQVIMQQTDPLPTIFLFTAWLLVLIAYSYASPLLGSTFSPNDQPTDLLSHFDSLKHL